MNRGVAPRPSAPSWRAMRRTELDGVCPRVWLASAILLALLSLGCLPRPPVAAAPPRVARVGLLSSSSTADPRGLDAFRLGMEDKGYQEGRHYVLETRFADGRAETLKAQAADLVRLRVDAIVAGGSQAAAAARDATDQIPIVMAAAGDPVGAGLVSSLARPGGNVTGVTQHSTAASRKRLEILVECCPDVSRVAYLSDPANPVDAPLFHELADAAPRLGLEIWSIPVRQPDELPAAIESAKRQGADALYVFGGVLFMNSRTRLAQLAAQYRLPAIYHYREFVQAGGLMAYGVQFDALYRDAAGHVDRLLRGASAAELPVTAPTRFELVINLSAARAVGLAIPAALLQDATEVIQ